MFSFNLELLYHIFSFKFYLTLAILFMKFLQTVCCLGLVVGAMAATPKEEEKEGALLATSITCGGRVWTDGEKLGNYGWGEPIQDVITKIVNNRVYIYHLGDYQPNLGVLYGMTQKVSGWPETNPEIDALRDACVNPPDPGIIGGGYLQPAGSGAVTCNGKLITNNLLIGTYIGTDHVHSETYARVIDNMLLGFVWRREGEIPFPNPTTEGFNSSLLYDVVEGENGSFFNSALGYTLSEDEIRRCFYLKLPVPLVTSSPCSAQPAVSSVTSITPSSLSFVFTGSGITVLKWRIKPVVSNSANERSGTTGTTSSGSTVPITYNALPAGSYKLEIEGQSCTSNTATFDFTITCVPTSLSTITSIKPYGLTANFAAANYNVLTWSIKNSVSTTVLSGSVTTSAGAMNRTLSYPALAAGTYTLDIQSPSCPSGSSSKAFRTSAVSFDVTSIDGRGICDRGPTVFEILSSSNSGMSFRYDANEVYSIAWRVLNEAKTVVVANNSEDLTGSGNVRSISFNLSDGKYWLEIQGGTTCKSVPDQEAFGINVALPIRIASFQGQAKKEGINLTWNVVSEDNGDRFQLLRFDDNEKTPKMLGEVPLREQSIGNYEFLDKSPASGANYYQLKQFDKDGTFSMSRIIAVNYEQLYEMVLAPNPAKEFVDVDFESRINGTATFETYNISGIRVLSLKQKVKIGKNKIHINVANLADGNYILKINNQDQTKSMRFLKLR